MAIITRKVNRFRIAQLPLKLALVMSTGLSLPTLAQQAPGLNFTARATAEVIEQSVQSDSLTQSGLTTFSVRPQVTASYQSKRVGASLVTSVTHLERENDVGSQEDTFAEYSYLANASLIENVLTVSASGALNFQNAQAGNFLLNDFVNDQGQLRKTRINTLTSQLSWQNGNWIRGSGNVTYGNVESEQNELLNIPRLETDIVTSQVQLSQGDKVRGLVFNVSGQYRDVDQNVQLGQGDFNNRFIQASADFSIVGNWGLRINGQHEANEITNLATEFTAARRFNTYGAGITYQRSENRTVSVTYNITESDVEAQDEVEFLGLNLNWAFSSRTSIAANYTRRFFGESGNVSLRYNNRRFRSSLNYTEQVTTNSILLASNFDLATFVCPIGEQDIGACFQPPSLDFQPTPDQQFVQFGQQNFEVNDRVILRRSNNATFGYSFSKLSASLFLNYAEETFLDSDALRRTSTARLNTSYSIGAFTNLTASIAYADIEATATEDDIPVGGFQVGDSENLNLNLGVNRRFGRRLTMYANYAFIEGTGDVPIGIFGSDFKDRRVTIGLTYIYR